MSGKGGLTVKDIDIWEINEAFASVALRYMKDLGIDHEITNVNGGAIAMGHPLGATGGMLVSTVLDELERRRCQTGNGVACIAGGMGDFHAYRTRLRRNSHMGEFTYEKDQTAL